MNIEKGEIELQRNGNVRQEEKKKVLRRLASKSNYDDESNGHDSEDDSEEENVAFGGIFDILQKGIGFSQYGHQKKNEIERKYEGVNVNPVIDVEKSHKMVGVVYPPNVKIKQMKEPRNFFIEPKPDDIFSSGSARPALSERNSPRTMFARSVKEGGATSIGNDTDGNPSFIENSRPIDVDFQEIVDEDETQAYEDYISELLCGRFVESTLFRIIVLVAILLNTILVGLQTDKNIERTNSSILQAFDSMFLTIFVIEILLKWYNNFWMFWKVGWNVFDFLLVFISIVGDGMSFLKTGRVLKIFRVLRAFRSLRSISALKGLQMVVQTIIRSLPDMANILGLALIVNFIFAVTGVDIFGTTVPQYFGSIGQSMFTLFILMTQDGWVDINEKMDEEGLSPQSSIFFALYILIGALVFVNIIVGVTVTNLQMAYKENSNTVILKNSATNQDETGKGIEMEQNITGFRYKNCKSINKMTENTWRSQEPYQIPDFSRVSIQSVENYFLILSAIEDNLGEFLTLKTTLERILEIVKRENIIEIQQEEEFLNNWKEITSSSDDSSDDDYSDDEYDEGGGADALTMMLNKKEENELERDGKIEALKKRRSMQVNILKEEEKLLQKLLEEGKMYHGKRINLPELKFDNKRSRSRNDLFNSGRRRRSSDFLNKESGSMPPVLENPILESDYDEKKY